MFVRRRSPGTDLTAIGVLKIEITLAGLKARFSIHSAVRYSSSPPGLWTDGDFFLDIHKLQKEFALEHGAGALLAIASSFYTAKAMVKQGFQILRSIEYASFELPDGTKPFANVNLGVHRTRSLGVLKLTSNKEREDKRHVVLSNY